MNLLVSRVFNVFVEGVQFAFHSFQVEVTDVLVLQKVDDDFFDWGRYLALAVQLRDEIFALFFEPFLVIFQFLKLSFPLNEEKVVFVTSFEDFVFEPDTFGDLFSFVKAVNVELGIRREIPA